MHVRYSPLAQQFAEVDAVFDELRALVKSGDFTLGKPVQEFEQLFAAALGVKHAIGVGSGTDALKIPLRALGIGPGDEVITAANTFWWIATTRFALMFRSSSRPSHPRQRRSSRCI
jgi:aminotransferase EvaB